LIVEGRKGEGVVEIEHTNVHLPFDILKQVLATGVHIGEYFIISVQERVCLYAKRRRLFNG
jgi:hypothetical protein